MSLLYLDCISGISGDMTLASLVDAGADKAYIEQELAKLQIEPYKIVWKKVNKNGIAALKADIVSEHEPHAHRHYSEIVEMIRTAGLPERVVERSLAVFHRIGQAEAKIHGVPLEHVHFHEVGAVDSIVDIVGVALALESLEVELIYVSPVPLGYGTVKCAHGIYPVPAPATLEMMIGLPIASLQIPKELTTPTGAGIVSSLAAAFSSTIPEITIKSIGYGAGSRDLPERPNVLRAIVGSMTAQTAIHSHRDGIEQAAPLHHPHHGHHHDHHHGHHHHDHHHDHQHEHQHDLHHNE
ncbi:nickel pincer cofactor biosynthesis protein LarC [Paenibacillus montanisoli]|uniref:Nickel pincer cofactor biosynthesis protein LarC n=1 Tax=Paenibacillus montanisoli TaxID=2081970 RepID=A0A328U1F2_9BACL|nr:nickel pincer cofactor biosynthesis protein LarC [Paenibacillus montanisoli]RAP76597.1 nickel pincer cofactor biosynthesis protein LarC [Paenibacillus montanisoli]